MRPMAKLYFRYGPMNSGKSTALLQVAHNYKERGMRVVIAKPNVDTKSDAVLSRLKVSGKVDWPVNRGDSILALLSSDEVEANAKIDCILVDEAQFLEPAQIDELFKITVAYDIPVIAYGIRTDFLTHSFPGSRRLMELAHSIDEMKTICSCGSKAILNARREGGRFTSAGDAVAIDGEGVEYEALCGRCYLLKVGDPQAKD